MKVERATVRAIAALVLCASTACVSTETGNPPLTPGVELGRIETQQGGGQPGTRPPLVWIGGRGALPPSTVRLWITPLETADRPLEVRPGSDGSFDAMTGAFPGDEFRLQVDEGVRRPPVDLVVAGSRPVVAVRELGDCFEVPLEVVVPSLTDSARIRVQNACDTAIDVAAPRARTADVVTTADAFTLAPGEAREIEATLVEAEGIVFVEAVAPTADRRPVTVRLP